MDEVFSNFPQMDIRDVIRLHAHMRMLQANCGEPQEGTLRIIEKLEEHILNFASGLSFTPPARNH